MWAARGAGTAGATRRDDARRDRMGMPRARAGAMMEVGGEPPTTILDPYARAATRAATRAAAEVRTMRDARRDSLGRCRGVTAYAVAQRTRETCIRGALGTAAYARDTPWRPNVLGTGLATPARCPSRAFRDRVCVHRGRGATPGHGRARPTTPRRRRAPPLPAALDTASRRPRGARRQPPRDHDIEARRVRRPRGGRVHRPMHPLRPRGGRAVRRVGAALLLRLPRVRRLGRGPGRRLVSPAAGPRRRRPPRLTATTAGARVATAAVARGRTRSHAVGEERRALARGARLRPPHGDGMIVRRVRPDARPCAIPRRS